MEHILRICQLIPLLIIGNLVWQIYRKFKSIPEDEVIGEERTKYMTRRLTWIAVCGILIAILQVTSTILRMLEII